MPEFQRYQQQFVDYIRAPHYHKNIPQPLPNRSHVYAKLLYSKIEGSLDTCFPISCQLLGDNRWQQLIQSFIKDHQCISPLYREIPNEFVDFLMNAQTQLTIPAFIIELAHYEWMELILETQKSLNPIVSSVVPKDLLKNIPLLNPILHLLHYHYPVKEIKASDPYWKNWHTRNNPYPQQTIILAGVRDSEDNIHFIELNAVTARLIELVQKEVETGKQSLLTLAAEMQYIDQKSILPFGKKILQQLEDQQIIIGVKPDP